jgi:hypothetical protein
MDVTHHDAGPAELGPRALPPEVPPGSAVPGGPERRQLSFRASGLTIELEITGRGDYRRFAGQLIPRQSAVVDIRHGHGVITVEAGTLGRFSAEEVPFGQVSLRCRLGGDRAPVVTGWISLLGHKNRGAGPELRPGPRPEPIHRTRRAPAGAAGGGAVWLGGVVRAPQPKRSARSRRR